MEALAHETIDLTRLLNVPMKYQMSLSEMVDTSQWLVSWGKHDTPG
jgi:hypothetical protein